MMGQETCEYSRKVSKVARTAKVLVVITAAIKRGKVSKVSLGERIGRERRKSGKGGIYFSKKVL